MKLDQLKYFLAVANHQHIGKAANEIAITPSAISHSITALEEEFGCALIVKNGRRIQLTEDGKRLVALAESLLLQANELKTSMQNDSHELQGHYQMAATHCFAEQLLTPAWISLQNQYPLLSAEIISLRSHDVIEKLLSAEIDFGICLCPRSNPDLNIEILYEEYLHIAVRKNHPLFQFEAHEQLTKLKQFPIAASKSFNSIENCQSHPILQSLDITLPNTLLFDSYNVAISALSSSNLWSLIPESVLTWHQDKLSSLNPEFDSMKIEVCLVWPKNHEKSPLLSAIIHEISAQVKTLNR